MNTKRVKFSNYVQIKEIPSKNEEERGIIKYIRSGIMKLSDNANIKIMNTLNYLSPHKILITNGEDIPFRIYSMEKQWYNDDTSIIVAEGLNKSKTFLVSFVNEFIVTINTYIGYNTTRSIEYITNFGGFRVKIKAVSRLK